MIPDFLTSYGERVDMAAAMALVASEASRAGVAVFILMGRSRRRRVTRARQAACVAIHDQLGWSKVALARFFDRDRKSIQRALVHATKNPVSYPQGGLDAGVTV